MSNFAKIIAFKSFSSKKFSGFAWNGDSNNASVYNHLKAFIDLSLKKIVLVIPEFF